MESCNGFVCGVTSKSRVTEYHVDGFRFDLASVLCRGTDGSSLNAPPLIRVSAYDSTWSDKVIVLIFSICTWMPISADFLCVWEG